MKTIGIIALSGAVDQEKLNKAKSNLEKLGFNIKLSKNIFDKKRYLAGSDEGKLEALYEFLQDTEIDLIMCARGGYGAIRLVNKIDYDLIKANPKPFIGFSDVTALLLMIYKKTGMVTYHGLMACSDFAGNIVLIPTLNLPAGKGRWDSFKCFMRALNAENLEFQGTKIYKAGNAEGIMWGGNLSTIVSLCGLDFIPDEDFIFFAEDLNEPVYKIDKMFTQLFNIDKFRCKCKGVVLGDFLDVDNQDWLEEFFKEFEIPTVGGFRITHAQDKLTVPIGKLATLRDGMLFVSG